MKIAPCLSCQALNFRKDNEPQPATCPKCGGPLLTVDPRIGRATEKAARS